MDNVKYKKLLNYCGGAINTDNKIFEPTPNQTCILQHTPFCLNKYHSIPSLQTDAKLDGNHRHPYQILPIPEEMKSYNIGMNCDFTKCLQPTDGGCKSCKNKEEFKTNKGSCSTGTCGNMNLDPILEPSFNIREAGKNLLLLEDHLFQKNRRCKDCIIKHCALIEAFLEEALTLDKERKYTELLNDSLYKFKNIEKQINQCINKDDLCDEKCCKIGQNLRVIRKKLLLSGYNNI